MQIIYPFMGRLSVNDEVLLCKTELHEQHQTMWRMWGGAIRLTDQ